MEFLPLKLRHIKDRKIPPKPLPWEMSSPADIGRQGAFYLFACLPWAEDNHFFAATLKPPF